MKFLNSLRLYEEATGAKVNIGKTVSYEYTSTVASKLFNYASALSNLNVPEYLSNPQTCQCNESKFCYEPHGHVITGDLRVIENAKLRELVAKRPKYREPSRVN